MISERNPSVARLVNLLDGLQTVLESDRSSASDVSVNDVKAVVHRQLVAQGYGYLLLDEGRRRNRKSADKDRRLKLLRQLLARSPDLPSNLRAVFSGSRRPTDAELDKLVEDLTHLGFLRAKKKKK